MWQAYVNDGMDPNTNGLGYRYELELRRTRKSCVEWH